MKRKIALSLLCGMLLGSATACQSANTEMVTISFVQDGQATIIEKIAVGETLADIPVPVGKEGYTIVWDRMDFSSISKSITVKAIETPNVYLISYKVGEDVTFDGINFSVTYGTDFELATPTLLGKIFDGWKIEGTTTILESGTYLIADDITLVPVWSVDNNDEFSYVY